MRLSKTKTIVLVGTIMALFVASSIAVQPMNTDAVEPVFTLVAKTNGGGVRPDYLNFLKQHLARIGITVDVVVQDWPTFVYELIIYRDFDICYVGLQGGGGDPDFTGVYDENGSLNLFGYHTSMDYDEDLGTGINEWYMKQGTLIMPPDSEERVEHYWEWQQYLMDEICPLQPTFAPKNYVALWGNLEGYNFSDGLIQSWGKMSWDGSHTGQQNTDEIVITDAAWSDLNPLFQDDASSNRISAATMDPLIWYDADLSVWPHLAESYEMINNTHLRVVCREGIKWQTDPDGIFINEYFDAEDVYFTFHAWKTVSNDVHLFDWIEEMEIIDQYTMDIFIDGDPDTPENEPFAPFLPSIATRILPEHYLNQTQEADGVTPDILDASWNTFATNCFGTGLFEISAFTEGVETVLTVNDNCWRLDTDITDDKDLNWDERFGDFSGGLDQYRIRIIPDLQTALLEFEAGKVDVNGITWNSEKRYELIDDPNFDVQSDTVYSYGFFGYNMRESRAHIGSREPCPLDESMTIGLAIRKAISYATDRREINDVVHRGEYTISDTPLYPKMGVWNNPNIVRYNHDLDKARYYMTIAGYDIDYTITNPGFTYWMTFSAIVVVAAVSVFSIRKKKK